MNHSEIRAIRGGLSRAAFARLLGVTSLTVLRWELPQDNKEARRPRAKKIEELKRLAEAGVGRAESMVVPRGDEPEDDEDEASEPADDAALDVEQQARWQRDETTVMPFLQQLCGERWRQAEDDLLGLLAAQTLGTQAGRTLATLGLVQVQILARMDVRGALTVLLPILDDAERGELPAAVAGRAHVVATMVFGAPDSRTFDLGRVNAHAASAEALLDDDNDDLRVLSATSCIAASRFLGPDVTLHAHQSYASSLERASSPLARMLADGLAGLVATVKGDTVGSTEAGGRALTAAEQLGFWGLVMGILSDYTAQLLRGSALPDEVLKISAHGRACADRAALLPTEGFIRLLACESEALSRLARFDEAYAVAQEALALARRAGLARYALTAPLARLLLHTGRDSELEALAASFEGEVGGPQRLAARAHAAYVRCMLTNVQGDYAGAAELAEVASSVPDTTPGQEYLMHAAHFELVANAMLSRNTELGQRAVRRFDELLEQRPSIWYASLRRRAESISLMQQGRFGEARQRIATTRATFELIGDRVQTAFEDGGLAMIAMAMGAPDAPALAAAIFERVERLGVSSEFLKRRAHAITAPIAASFHEQSTTEKLLVALERLSVRGLEQAAFRRELGAVLASLFAGREALIGVDEEAPGLVQASLEGEAALSFGVAGAVSPEERALLVIIAGFLSQRPAAAVRSEPEAKLEGVLPGFLALAPNTRQLKSEIVRLSRSRATILVSGESGSGKEVVARAVHDVSPRSERPYVTFNCASVPRDLFESQLFGYRKGAFTGAVSDSPGVIRAADGGTLFLDEIGELPLEVQPKLLRFLENGEIFPLGEQKARRVDVRIVAATHRDLGRLVREQRFREDLYYRLNVVPLRVPPLRERKQDVVALARLFIGRLAGEASSAPQLGSDAIHALEQHTWPGNVRELRNVIERAMAYAPVPSVLSAEHLRIARR